MTGWRIAVASGKGGTGKTTVAVALALALKDRLPDLQFLDCDVEEPNADLFLKPEFAASAEVAIQVPQVDNEKCTGCGECQELCQYNAIAVVSGQALIFENLCHGCGGCRLVCPESAITEHKKRIGVIDSGLADSLHFSRGVLDVGQPMATPVIRALKSGSRPDVPTILDSPPGTACPVIETVRECRYCILVTEPTPFGLYDLKLMVGVVEELGIPAGLVINKDDSWSINIEDYAAEKGLPVLMKIPFERSIASLLSDGIPLNEADDSWNEKFTDLYRQIERSL